MTRVLPFVACVLVYAMSVHAMDDQRKNAILLNGQWEFALGDGNERPYAARGDEGLAWQKVMLPGRFVPYSVEATRDIAFAWARRTFTLTPEHAATLSQDGTRIAVLRWNRIAHGARAYINGREVGYNEPTGPYQVIVPRGVFNAGENEILLKIAGAAGVRRAKSGHFLFPCGQIWGPSRPELVGVMQDVWIDFSDRAYMKWILAIPRVKEKCVTIRVTPVALQSLEDLDIDVTIRPWRANEGIGYGECRAQASVVTDPLDGEHFCVDVPLTDFAPWTPKTPQLYTASVRLLKDGCLLDEATVRFGMREIDVVDGDYKLNGKSLWIRGSNLVHEWEWASVIDDNEVDYLVAEARELNTNAFRTHTQPPSPEWSNVCDEHGTMLLAEFPLLYNYRNHGYTDEEWEIFHRNAMTDAAGWMSRLWNHPSVVMWVLSNESRSDNAWSTLR